MAVAARARSHCAARPCPAAGFTLIEILVVLVVLGVAAGVVALQLGHDSNAALRLEAERLRSNLEHGAQLAQWRHEPLLWEADAAGYRFLRPDAQGEWREDPEPELARHALPDSIRMRLTGPAGAPAPLRLLLRASGRNDPYTVVIEGATGAWVLRADPLNRLTATPAG